MNVSAAIEEAADRVVSSGCDRLLVEYSLARFYLVGMLTGVIATAAIGVVASLVVLTW